MNRWDALDEMAATVLQEREDRHAQDLRLHRDLSLLDHGANTLATFLLTVSVFTGQPVYGAAALAVAGGWAFLRDETAANLRRHYTRKDETL